MDRSSRPGVVALKVAAFVAAALLVGSLLSHGGLRRADLPGDAGFVALMGVVAYLDRARARRVAEAAARGDYGPEVYPSPLERVLDVGPWLVIVGAMLAAGIYATLRLGFGWF